MKQITLSLFLIFLYNNLLSQGCFEKLEEDAERIAKTGVEFPNNVFTAIENLVGCTAPSFKARSIDGDSILSDDLKGKVVMINFWFSGCQPCVEEMPGFNKLVEEYKDRGVVFIGFTRDHEPDIRRFLKDYQFDFTLVADAMPVAETFGMKISAWPLTFIYDKQGVIRYVRMGGFAPPHPEERAYETIMAILEKQLY